jgi:hypothetical protein
MNKYLVSETYETITYESAEKGDVAESGFNFQDSPMSAQEIADYLALNGYTEASSNYYHPKLCFTCYGEMDAHSGEVGNTSLHFEAPERIVRAICKYAGIELK